jgi:hypothetical protein
LIRNRLSSRLVVQVVLGTWIIIARCQMFLSRKNIMRGWVIIALGLGGWKGATCISLAGNYQEEASDDGGKSTGKEQPAHPPAKRKNLKERWVRVGLAGYIICLFDELPNSLAFRSKSRWPLPNFNNPTKLSTPSSQRRCHLFQSRCLRQNVPTLNI